MGEPSQPPQYQPLPGWYQAAYPLPPQPHFVHPAALSSRDREKEREEEVAGEEEEKEIAEEVHFRDFHENSVGEEESRKRDDDEVCIIKY